MRIAIMQPYFYPYIGYFELMSRVDRFVLLCDVQYIRRGWVNRNRIRSAGEPGWQYLTIPVVHAPQSTLIREIRVSGLDWHARHCKTLEHTFGRKAYGHLLFQDYRSVVPTLGDYLCTILCHTLASAAAYLGIGTPLTAMPTPQHLKGQDKIIAVCKSLGATTYVNPPGGRELYQESAFADAGLRLEFQPPTSHPNKLSILDVCLGDGLTRL